MRGKEICKGKSALNIKDLKRRKESIGITLLLYS